MTDTVHALMRLAAKTSLRFLLAILVFLGFLALAGCHSYHVDTTVENRTGKPVKLLEVDYPSASFGTGQLDSGAIFSYQMQFRNSGPLKVLYTADDGRQVSIDGPHVAEKQEGRMQIVLLPDGKAEFHPELTPAP
jgi:hypothetical protein